MSEIILSFDARREIMNSKGVSAKTILHYRKIFQIKEYINLNDFMNWLGIPKTIILDNKNEN